VNYVLLKFINGVDLKQKQHGSSIFFSRKNTDSLTSRGCPRENGRKVYGGVPKKEQLPAVRAGAPILVATPGRLNDFLECLRKGNVC